MADIQRMIPRLVSADDDTRLFTATHATLAIPAPLTLIDAIAIMPGQGEHARVTNALNQWESGMHFRFLLVGGTNKIEVKQPQLSLERLRQEPFNLQRTDNVHTQVTATHTREQTDWIIEQVLQHNVSSLALYASDWHLPRAYRSLLKSMLNASIRIPIFPVAVGSSPRQVVPELGVPVDLASVGEARRIHKYEQIGEIVSYDELMDYLDWLWAQDVTPIQLAP